MFRFLWMSGVIAAMLAMSGSLSFADGPVAGPDDGSPPPASAPSAPEATPSGSPAADSSAQTENSRGRSEQSKTSESLAPQTPAAGERNAPAEVGPAPDADADRPARTAGPPPDINAAFLADPFTLLELDMDSASSDLSAGKTKPPVEVTQPRILTRLDYMISELEKATAKGGSGAGRNPVRPAEASTLGRGPGGQGELRAARQDGRQWADLSEKEREKILQSRTSGFPPGYEDILADYFRRLARGESDATDAADATNSADATDATDATEGHDAGESESAEGEAARP